jgi:putative endonuclease
LLVASLGVTEAGQRVGRTGETLAVQHLARRGFRVLERNYRTRWGELDIVAFDGQELVFCEVKTRRAGFGCVWPLESVHPHKRRQVRRMASSWLRDRPDHPYARVIRFDAIGVTVDRAGRLLSLEHLEGAF